MRVRRPTNAPSWGIGAQAAGHPRGPQPRGSRPAATSSRESRSAGDRRPPASSAHGREKTPSWSSSDERECAGGRGANDAAVLLRYTSSFRHCSVVRSRSSPGGGSTRGPRRQSSQGRSLRLSECPDERRQIPSARLPSPVGRGTASVAMRVGFLKGIDLLEADFECRQRWPVSSRRG
jgi:hypothetical protein